YSNVAPIIVDSEKRFLTLRHQKLGEWYFETIPDGKQVQEEILEQCLNHVNSHPYSYLLRNLYRNPEFIKTELHRKLPNTRVLSIIDQYLESMKYYDTERF